ncbi:MAG TPA: isocitrate lyase/phosphoenolpyruvate mutase family protein [Marmoricola sp.]|jgi:2-methylisocitrate lyase-like PEP mutase family enzyme|nr:isocitrate lyase/phosphoenolpyruvate mutase family protein [Marmoricola sp.]
MNTPDLQSKAEALLALHVPGTPGVLPTVWDAWSANVAAAAGFRGLTVGSHPLADSIGRPDGEGMTFIELTTRVTQITESMSLPVSVDIESGYGESASTLIDGLLEAGAVGLNIEDTVHSEGGRMRSSEEHAALIGELRAAADAAGVAVVINARTDTFKNQLGEDDERVDLAIARMIACAEAGASSLYPVGFHDEETLTRICAALPLPVNAIADPTNGDLAMYARAGAGRISFGPLWQMSLAKVSAEWLARWQ